MKLLVIVVRGLQAGALGAYGNRLVETSCLNTLAFSGVVFDQHFALHPDPETARRVWRSGCHHFGPPVARPDVLEVVMGQGVAARLIVDRSRGGFEEFEAGWPRIDRVADTPAAVELAREALATAGDSWLTWLELAALLPPWRVPAPIVEAYFAPPDSGDDEEADEEEEDEDEDEESGDLIPPEEPLEPLFAPTLGPIDDDDQLYLRLRETYAAAVSHVDGLLGDLLDGLPDDIHVILTSDHGLPLGEHGVVGLVDPRLHQEVVQVPLIVYGPGCRPGRRVEALTGSIDLAPTIAELAGIRLGEAQGASLVPCLSGGAAPARDYLGLGGRQGDAQEYGLRARDLSMLLPVTDGVPRARLFLKPDDGYEVNDLSQHYFEKIESLERTLRMYVEEASKPGPLAAPPLEA
ncbi:MAG: sulfatase-like hydrolase/transferase [Gemmataceae bacterium]